MKIRLSRLAQAVALASGVFIVTGTLAMKPQAVADSADALITPVFTPLGIGQHELNVVVQLGADPVAVQQGNAGRKLSNSEKDRIKAQLKSAQDTLRPSIQGLGGTVLASYQSAYNGMKVRIATNRLSQLAALPGVVAVRTLQLQKPSNVNGIPLIGAPGLWQGLGLHGEGVKIAVIDTGIDYTHANFGGTGTAAAYAQAHAHETEPADPALFGPDAPRVKGGTDLVGDTYNADPSDPKTYQPIPHPDPNPLDCNDHGSHVAGTAAGSGVTADGKTYTGVYNASTVSGNSWTIGPGVAPKADIYSIRVFGCAGSTDVTVDAIDWAVDHDMDVINMSLGSSFGSIDEPSTVASTNAAKAGIVVVASAGNDGANPYIVGSPAVAPGAIAVAANDAVPTFAGASIALANGTTMDAIDANGFAFTQPLSNYTIKVIKNDPATAEDESIGCSVAAFGALSPNTIAVVKRGTCARVAKAIFGQQAGAAAVVMVNTDTGFPPFEGPITSNPDDGVPFNVTIPFLGVRGLPTGSTSDGAKLLAADGVLATVAGKIIANPTYLNFATFSSGGPRSGDSGLKPDLTAPGVSVTSTQSGSGNGALTISGTSMASPHVAGSAVLVRQAHPAWSVADIKSVLVNTGNPAEVANYKTSIGGTGLVQPGKAAASQVVASVNSPSLDVALNYGFADIKKDFGMTQSIKLKNNGSVPATFNVSQANPSGRPHTLSFSTSSITVPGNSQVTVAVTLKVPAATAGVANGPGLSFNEVAGLVQFTPKSSSDNANVTLRVPYYFVPRPSADVSTTLGTLAGTNPETTATVTNKQGVVPGDADFYAWGITAPKVQSLASNDIRAVGTQSFPFTSTSQLLVFAVNTYKRWSNASANEFDIYVDVDGDGNDDYIVVGVDQGALQTGTFNGQMGSFVFSTRSAGASTVSLASAPTDGSTAELLVLTSQLCRTNEPCLSAANPRITYHIAGFDLNSGAVKDVADVGKFNVWSNAVSTGGFAGSVAPRASDTTNTIAVNSAEWAFTPAKGVMIVTLDNASGESEAQLIPITIH